MIKEVKKLVNKKEVKDGKWKNWNQSEKFCIILSNTLLTMIALLLIYICFFGPLEKYINIIKFSYESRDLWGVFFVTISYIGLSFVFITGLEILNFLLYPKTDKESELAKKLKQLRKEKNDFLRTYREKKKLLKYQQSLKEVKNEKFK